MHLVVFMNSLGTNCQIEIDRRGRSLLTTDATPRQTKAITLGGSESPIRRDRKPKRTDIPRVWEIESLGPG